MVLIPHKYTAILRAAVGEELIEKFRTRHGATCFAHQACAHAQDIGKEVVILITVREKAQTKVFKMVASDPESEFYYLKERGTRH